MLSVESIQVAVDEEEVEESSGLGDISSLEEEVVESRDISSLEEEEVVESRDISSLEEEEVVESRDISSLEEEVVESSRLGDISYLEEVEESRSGRLGDIYTLVAEGCYPQTMNPLRKKNLKRYAQKFSVEDGRLYYVGPKKEEKRQVVMEPETKRHIFLDCHFNDVGQHLGQKKTVHRIQSQYYWLGIVKDVVDWIKVCDTCQQNERNKSLARTVRPIKVDAPWDIVGIDIIGPFPETHQGHTRVLTLMDYFSKWVEAFPIQKMDIPSVARCISKSIYRFGAPKTIVCRQSVDFCNEVALLLRERWNLSQPVSPLVGQLNPLHDPTAGLLNDAIARMVAEKQAEWDDFLDCTTFLFRMTVTANMNTAYKQQKKTSKRRLRNMPSMTFKITDPMFGAGESPAAKKLKADSLFMSFSAEADLPAASETDFAAASEADLTATTEADLASSSEADLATAGSCSEHGKSDLEYPLPTTDHH
ncbi:hypothetical protein NHX12_028299 [Muraenolepis orangiensis]|uniref:Gypsy retrotransposon integrase-like protein 1 n=1 Tax=Muraenolepis orangiensis TaxID=630683 RepID=A0A9Q0EBJ4_9TELE|nr:hypothetical protein NHX12_028299 [Muraenolepis orangiensis]